LCEQTFDLAEAFANFGAVVGGEVVEGEGEEGFHCGGDVELESGFANRVIAQRVLRSYSGTVSAVCLSSWSKKLVVQKISDPRLDVVEHQGLKKLREDNLKKRVKTWAILIKGKDR
jgi:uncharacterized protein YuzB (UPF0349 family)